MVLPLSPTLTCFCGCRTRSENSWRSATVLCKLPLLVVFRCILYTVYTGAGGKCQQNTPEIHLLLPSP